MLLRGMLVAKMLVTGSLLLGACYEGEHLESQRYAVGQPGPWVIPDEVLAVGDQWYVEYTGAGPWVGPESCSGGMEPGTAMLRDYLLEWFPQTYSIGGYSCRAIVGAPNVMSVHGTGRALDIMLPLAGGEADNDLGDPIGNWLIENAEHIGIQFIIWDRWTWGPYRTPGEKGEYYSGQHPHHDHLHVELSVEAAQLGTPFFQGEPGEPDLFDCGVMPAEGGVLDDTDPCVQLFGPAEFWRVEEGVGHGGRMAWTNAYSGDEPSNWARWRFELEAAGDYDLEVYIDPSIGRFADTRYQLRQGDRLIDFTLDQSSADGWALLGAVALDAGPAELRVSDAAGREVAEEQHIAIDALRLGPATGAPIDEDDEDQDEDVTPEPGAELAGGCAVGGRPGGAAWLLALALLGLRRRKSATPK